MDKVFIGREQIVITSYYHDSAQPTESEDLEEGLRSEYRSGEVLTYARKREFDTSPSGGDAGNRTPVRCGFDGASPCAVCENATFRLRCLHKHLHRRTYSYKKFR